jgi:hypothetical protein
MKVGFSRRTRLSATPISAFLGDFTPISPEETFMSATVTTLKRVAAPVQTRAKRVIPYLVITICSAAFFYLFLRVLWRVGDEGTIVYGAERALHGQIPGRDFIDVIGPGAFYWLAAWFRVLGTSFFVARLELLFESVSMVFLIFFVARRLGASGWLASAFWAIVSLPLWPAASHHWTSDLFALLSFAAFVWWNHQKRAWLLFWCGIFAGVVSTIIQQKGLYLLAAYLAILFWLERPMRRSWRSCAQLLVGYAAIGAFVLLFYWRCHALADLLYANLAWPLHSYRGINHVPYAFALSSLFEQRLALLHFGFTFWTAAVLAVLSVLPFCTIAVLPFLPLAAAAFRRNILTPNLVLYLVPGFALFLSEMHRCDIQHVVFGSPILLVVLLSAFSKGMPKYRLAIGTFAVACLVLCAGIEIIPPLAVRNRTNTRRGGLLSPAPDPALSFLASIPPGEPVFIYPDYSMYNFLMAEPNPTRWSSLMYGFNPPEQFRDATNDLERKQVKYVLWDTLFSGGNLKRWFPEYIDPPPDKLIMEPYIESHYRQIGLENGFRIMERKRTAYIPASEQTVPHSY